MNEFAQHWAAGVGYVVMAAGSIASISVIVWMVCRGAWTAMNATYGIGVVLRLLMRRDLVEMSKECEELKKDLQNERQVNRDIELELIEKSMELRKLAEIKDVGRG